jgi:hypothetical protein
MKKRVTRNVHCLYQIILAVLALSAIAKVINYEIFLKSFKSLMLWYTNSSNLIVAFTLILCAVYNMKDKNPQWLILLRSGATLWVIITSIVYHFILANPMYPFHDTSYQNLVLHYIVPIGMLFDWIIFEKKNKYKFYYPILWLSYPLMCLVFYLIYGLRTNFYPYWFVNPYESYPQGIGSYTNLILLVLALTIGFLVLGYIFVWFDHISKKSRKEVSCDM